MCYSGVPVCYQVVISYLLLLKCRVLSLLQGRQLYLPIMPKEAASSVAKVRAYAAEFPTELIVTSGNSLFCKLCSAIICQERRSSVLNHRNSTKHTRAKDAENQTSIDIAAS